MIRNSAWILVAIFIISLLIVVPAAGDEMIECNPSGGVEICIQDVEISEDTIKEGQTAEVIIQLENIGEITGTARIIVDIERGDEQLYHHINSVEVSANDSVTVTESLRAEDPGLREVNILIMNPDETHLYDSTGYSHIVSVEEDSRDWSELLSTVNIVVGIIAAIVSILAVKRRF